MHRRSLGVLALLVAVSLGMLIIAAFYESCKEGADKPPQVRVRTLDTGPSDKLFYGPYEPGLAGSSGRPQYSLGQWYNCRVTPDGDVDCFHHQQQPPDPDGGESGYFPGGPHPRHSYVQVEAAREFVCGLTKQGGIDCWGNSDELFRCDAQSRCIDFRVPEARRYEQVAAGLFHACALDEDGEAECWGLGGDPDADERLD